MSFIAPHIPVFDRSKRDDGTFSRIDFRGGKRLGTSGTVHEGKTLLYCASKLDCDVCPLKPQCCPKEPSRKIPLTSMSTPETLPGRSQAPTASAVSVSARRSRCGSHTC